jgi:hypothetical protein
MSDLQKTLQALQPYLIGIRYLEGIPIIDAVFKDGWFVPDSKLIKRIKAENEHNHFMIFSDTEGIGLDELLQYLETTIKANIERELKIELLKVKVNELKEIFKDNSLSKLKTLKFILEDDLIPNLDDISIEDKESEEPNEIKNIIAEPTQETDSISEIREISEEDKEILAEEERAENFKKWKESQKFNKKLKKIASKVELPPKKNTEVDVMDEECECGPDEACSKCIHRKDL